MPTATSDFNVQFFQLTKLCPGDGAARSRREGPNKLVRQREG